MSDRDPRFTSVFWRTLCELVRINPALSSAFHPQTDGQTERMNRILQDYLQCFVNPLRDNWDSLLGLAEYAINNSVNVSTGYTPFFLNTGRHPLNPLILKEQPISKRDRGENTGLPALDALLRNISQAISNAKKCIQAAQARQKAYVDKRRRDLILQVGDPVLLNSADLHIRTVFWEEVAA